MSVAREQVTLLLLRISEEIVSSPFVIVFLASGMPPECGPTLDFLRTLLVALPLSIHVALRSFYLVHPTLMTRVSFMLFGIALWGKLHFVDHLHHLRAFFPAGHLLVPQAVVMEDEE